MCKHNPKLTQNLDESSKKLLQSLIETLTHGQEGSQNPELSTKSQSTTANSSMIDDQGSDRLMQQHRQAAQTMVNQNANVSFNCLF